MPVSIREVDCGPEGTSIIVGNADGMVTFLPEITLVLIEAVRALGERQSI